MRTARANGVNNYAEPNPFVLSPSTSSGQALSKYERARFQQPVGTDCDSGASRLRCLTVVPRQQVTQANVPHLSAVCIAAAGKGQEQFHHLRSLLGTDVS